MEKQKRNKRVQAGDFILRNNRCSSKTNQSQIKGIFVDESCYLDIDSIVKTPVSKKEALLYGHKLHLSLPTKKQMALIERQLEIINNRLLSIGRGDCLLLGTIFKDFWTRNAKKTDSADERRYVLFLVPV